MKNLKSNSWPFIDEEVHRKTNSKRSKVMSPHLLCLIGYAILALGYMMIVLHGSDGLP